MRPQQNRPKGQPQTDKKQRNSKDLHNSKPPSGQVWLYGHHAVLCALENSSRKVRRLILSTECARTWDEKIKSALKGRPALSPETVDKVEFDRHLSPNAVHQGMAALVDALPSPAIEDLIPTAGQQEQAVILILDQVTDPHNVGACLRSAAAFGAIAMIVPDRHAPEETGTLAKAASGALERLPLIRVTNLVRALEQLKEGGFWIAGLAGEASQTLAQAKLSGRIALVMGAEGEGLRRLTREHCDYLVKLPISDKVESLNVSNAAAVALYELARNPT